MASDCKQSRLSIDHILAQFLSRVGMQTLRTGFGVKGWDACQCFVQERDLKLCETVYSWKHVRFMIHCFQCLLHRICDKRVAEREGKP